MWNLSRSVYAANLYSRITEEGKLVTKLIDIRRFSLAALLTVTGAALASSMKLQQEKLAAVLVAMVVANLVRRWLRHRSMTEAARHAFVVITTGVIGYLTEAWGTTNGHWTYHHLPPGQHVPFWVPVAWAIAGELLHFVESAATGKSASRIQNLAFVYALGIVFPFLGEAICVANGVWTYHWPYQIAGIPVAALLLIAYTHFVFSAIRAGIEQKSVVPVSSRSS
jgi:uncharacterized membrane protein